MTTAEIRRAFGLDNLADPFLRDAIIRKHNNSRSN
jgi:hypothetical protein|tara:strand:- start:207 stop:311 length:105 start_codon:yes stop_codon:yes gene_type:complete